MAKQYPFSQLLSLFAQLDTIMFDGVRIGSAPANFLRHDFTLELKEGSWKDTWRSRLNRWRYYYGLSHKQQHAEVTLSQGRYLFNLVSLSDSRFTEFMLPVIDKLSAERSAFITYIENKTAARGVDTILFDGLNKNEHQQWLRSYKKIGSQVKQTIASLQAEYGFGSYVKEELHSAVIYYTQSIFKNTRLLQQIKPLCVFTDHDQQFENAALISSANALGIPTYTFIHGSTFPLDNYLPLKAGYVICWGEMHKKQFIQAGYAENRMLICGNPKIREAKNKPKQQIKLPFPLPEEKLICLLASNKIDINDRLLFLRTFKEATHQAGVFGIHKMHPLETVADYTDAGMPASDLSYSVNKNELSASDAIALADVIVCHNTNFALDALLAGKIVVILDCISYYLGIGEVLIREAGCPHARNEQELAAILSRIATDDTYRSALKENAVSFAKHLCAAKGDDAAQLTFDEIQRTLLIHTHDQVA